MVAPRQNAPNRRSVSQDHNLLKSNNPAGETEQSISILLRLDHRLYVRLLHKISRKAAPVHFY